MVNVQDYNGWEEKAKRDGRYSPVSDRQPAKVVQPGEGPFCYPRLEVMGNLRLAAWPMPFTPSFR